LLLIFSRYILLYFFLFLHSYMIDTSPPLVSLYISFSFFLSRRSFYMMFYTEGRPKKKFFFFSFLSLFLWHRVSGSISWSHITQRAWHIRQCCTGTAGTRWFSSTRPGRREWSGVCLARLLRGGTGVGRREGVCRRRGGCMAKTECEKLHLCEWKKLRK
jgi:hypothetical protein